jgi:photosystem II stability/assembly factor-like uncharacterized protein
MISNVSGDSLWKSISQLSGREPVVIRGHLDTLITRYSYSWRIDRAADFLAERFESHGLDVAFHEYVVGTHSFFSTSFVDPLNGWVVGSDQRVYRTRDGGLSWVRQDPDAPLHSFWGACFVDTLEGWIAGTGGTIRHTADGGQTWEPQASSTGLPLNEVFFLDSENGWIAGYAGATIRTTDGGQTWNAVPTGTTSALYGLHFEAPDRGWACGENGTILFWDGFTWIPQTSGTSEYLHDVHFASPDTGWVAGGGATILKTTDGGITWMQQSAPEGASPFLRGASFASSVEGWIVGLNGTVIHTADGGATWEIQPTGTLFGLQSVRFASEFEGWAVGYGSTILHTANGGFTWDSQRENLPDDAILTWRNVVATKPGTASDEQVVICAHFDCTSETPDILAPGADDNASGTAAVLETARITSGYDFERTIKFICFSGEEQGLFGSGEYASDARAAGDSIIGAINLDMIGYVDSYPEDIDLIGNHPSEWLVDLTVACAGAYVPGLLTRKVIDPNEVLSDHASFWKAGYSALMGIEDKNLSYPYYHTTGDTLGNLTRAFATDVVRMGAATVAHLARPAEVAEPPEEAGCEDGDALADGVTIVSTTPNPFGGATRIGFTLGRSGPLSMRVVNVQGRVVKTLSDGVLPAGRHEATWNGTDASGRRVSPGIYFVMVDAQDRSARAKVLMLR